MLLQVTPLFVLTCHCTLGAGEPLAAAVSVTAAPGSTFWLTGWVVTTGTVEPTEMLAVVLAVLLYV